MSENYFESIIRSLKEDAGKINEGLESNLKRGDINTYISMMKALRTTLELIDEYDWQEYHSVYASKSPDSDKWIDMISVWEQNNQGNIRNHERYKLFDGVNLADLSNEIPAMQTVRLRSSTFD